MEIKSDNKELNVSKEIERNFEKNLNIALDVLPENKFLNDLFTQLKEMKISD